MALPGLRWLLVRLSVVLAAAAVALVVVLGSEGEDRGQPSGQPPTKSELALGSPVLTKFPRIDRCVRPGNTRGEDDHGLDVTTISARVESLRELSFRKPPRVQTISKREIDARVLALVKKSYDRKSAEVDQRLLSALRAIPPGVDLKAEYEKSLEGQVAGLYLPEKRTLLVLRGADPGLIERVTLAHELEHALADQVLGLPESISVDERGDRVDSALAETALAEGDATLLEEIYITRHAALGDLLDATAAISDLDLSALAEAPDYLQREFVFPYNEGTEFVCELYTRGGWRAVDRAYRNPPQTTSEVLFPDRYGQRPVDPDDPNPPGRGWRFLRSGQFGAAPLLWLLQAPGGEVKRAMPLARAAAAAWTGGEFRLWTRGEETALGISLAAGGQGGRSLCLGVAGWYGAANPDDARPEPIEAEALAVEGVDQAASIRCLPEGVRLGIAPTLPVARRIAAE